MPNSTTWGEDVKYITATKQKPEINDGNLVREWEFPDSSSFLVMSHMKRMEQIIFHCLWQWRTENFLMTFCGLWKCRIAFKMNIWFRFLASKTEISLAHSSPVTLSKSVSKLYLGYINFWLHMSSHNPYVWCLYALLKITLLQGMKICVKFSNKFSSSCIEKSSKQNRVCTLQKI